MSAGNIYRLKHDMPAWRITCPSSYWAWLGDSDMTWDHSTIRYPESFILPCSESWSIPRHPHLSPINETAWQKKIKLHFQRILWNFMWWLYHRPVEIPRTMAIEGDHHPVSFASSDSPDLGPATGCAFGSSSIARCAPDMLRGPTPTVTSRSGNSN